MSADLSRRPVRCIPAVVPPQAVSDRSIIDSVAGFINDVALTNPVPLDPKDTIQWARFESSADVSDPCYGDDWDVEGGCAPPLLLILGYGNGVQVWAIPANGEAIEVLSWRHGNVRSLRILPTPNASDQCTENEPADLFTSKRPLVAFNDNPAPTSPSQYYNVAIVSLRDNEMVKTIKFRNPIIDILANRSSIVITFLERIAVFDARTFEDRLTISTCHPSPGINLNPVALGSRWMAYAERKLMASKRSCGGCDGDGVASYTATVLNAAKSLGKGLRELGESMAAGLTGGAGHTNHFTGSAPFNTSSGSADAEGQQRGVVTIIDIKYPIKDASPTTGAPITTAGNDPIVAHFIAHSDAIVSLKFDSSGLLLLTADKRGHDFHIFRVHPHPGGASLAAVHHLYILHRGDTTAKVQDVAFSLDSRWIAVSTLRGTTHVFPISPYGGSSGMRTHGSPHVVNRLSRFHRSAGLSAEGRSNSPVSHGENMSAHSTVAYSNPRVPPFPHPTVVLPLAQLRQPNHLNAGQNPGQNQKSALGRQRLTSISDDSASPLRLCATFGRPRAWLLEPPGSVRDKPCAKMQRRAVDSLFIMASHGALIQYDLEPCPVANVPKEKVCDDTPIDLEVEAKAQWTLMRNDHSVEIVPPLPSDSWLIKERFVDPQNSPGNFLDRDDVWLSQVEIITHAGPHRRLWMGPQFIFKTYNMPSGSALSHIEMESVEVGIGGPSNRPARSNPMNIALTNTNRLDGGGSGGSGGGGGTILIESGSCSSYEQSPRLIDHFRRECIETDTMLGPRETQLREDLADAMRESPGGQLRDQTGSLLSRHTASTTSCFSYYSPSPDSASAGGQSMPPPSVIAAASSGPFVNSGCGAAMAKLVNPLGTVTTVIQNADDTERENTANIKESIFNERFIHENCDESLFRPVVAVLDTLPTSDTMHTAELSMHSTLGRPTIIGSDLIVPVIAEEQYESMKNKRLQHAQTLEAAAHETHPTCDTKTAPVDRLRKCEKSTEKGNEISVNATAVNRAELIDKSSHDATFAHEFPVPTARLKGKRRQKQSDKFETPSLPPLPLLETIDKFRTVSPTETIDSQFEALRFDAEDFPTTMTTAAAATVVKSPPLQSSLINFESPSKDTASDQPLTTFDSSNLIFALCSSLHGSSASRENSVCSSPPLPSPPLPPLALPYDDNCYDSDFKSLETDMAHETYLSLEHGMKFVTTFSMSSDDATTDGSSTISKLPVRHIHDGDDNEEDDEELQPLIDVSRSVESCRMPSDAVTDTTLPSSAGNADGDGEFDKPFELESALSEFHNADNSTAMSASSAALAGGGDNSGSTATVPSNGVIVGISGGGGTSTSANVSNGNKKKSKKKKR